MKTTARPAGLDVYPRAPARGRTDEDLRCRLPLGTIGVARIARAALIGWTAVGIGLVGSPRTALAVPAPCPASAGVSTCTVTVGAATLSIEATSIEGGSAVVRIDIDGVTQLAAQAFSVFSFEDAEFIDAVLLSATADPASKQIVLEFREAFFGAVDFTGRFTLSQIGDETILDESIEIVAGPGLPFGESAGGRIYAVSDFDLDGTPVDVSAVATAGGTLFTQTDGATMATIEVLSAPPTARQVAPCCVLEDILADVPLDLDGTDSVPGPGNFQHALSWDRSISTATPFTATLRKTILVPEPAALSNGLATAATLLVLGVHRRRRGPA